MKLVIGLGNPGKKYQNNRHNVGHQVVDKLKAQTSKRKDIVVTKTNIFMNDSGSYIGKLISTYHLEPSALYIIHDDLDLPLGTWKIQYAKGPKVHGGIADIEQKLGTKDFWRIRVGIDNRNPETRMEGEKYVLENFLPEERIILDKVINEIVSNLQFKIKSCKL